MRSTTCRRRERRALAYVRSGSQTQERVADVLLGSSAPPLASGPLPGRPTLFCPPCLRMPQTIRSARILAGRAQVPERLLGQRPESPRRDGVGSRAIRGGGGVLKLCCCSMRSLTCTRAPCRPSQSKPTGFDPSVFLTRCQEYPPQERYVLG